MTGVNRKIVLASRPAGAVTPDNFRLVESQLLPLAEGQVRVRNHYLSLDPYMRRRMDDARSYATPHPVGEVMIGETAGIVVESRNAAWKVGDRVTAMFGWQEYGISDGNDMQRVDDARTPLSAHLGVIGMPGITAWYGLGTICRPAPRETVAVSAASGAVGSVVGQLAKERGCRVVGIAGGADKCGYVVNELGFDACIDYKQGDLDSQLKQAAPNGIDCYFDNVGGPILDSIMIRMNDFGRIAMCGVIASVDGPPLPMRNPTLILRSRLLVQGFISTEHRDRWPAARAELQALLEAGRLKYRETVAHGLPAAPDAFIGLLKGRNFGKQLVKLA